MHQPDHLRHFIKSFRYLFLFSILLFISALILWAYLDLQTWFLLVLFTNSIILAIWLFYIYPIYSSYVEKSNEINLPFNGILNSNEISNRILTINSKLMLLEKLVTNSTFKYPLSKEKIHESIGILFFKSIFLHFFFGNLRIF